MMRIKEILGNSIRELQDNLNEELYGGACADVLWETYRVEKVNNPPVYGLVKYTVLIVRDRKLRERTKGENDD